nr:hypothetical protein GCM10020092_078230 [Actinoplanes digitatis]
MTTWPDPPDREIVEPLDNAYEHAALIIDSDDAVRARLVPVLNDLLTRGSVVLMIVSAKVELLVRTEFGALSDQLEWRETSSFYQRLGFAYEEFRRYTAEQHAQGRRVHIVAEPDIATEIDPSSPVDRAAEYLSYEVVYNDIIAPYDCPLTCIWDARRHSTLIIENVRLLHNHEIVDGGKLVPVQHVPALDYLARRNEIPLPPPPADTDLDFALSSLDGIGAVHTAVRSWALRQAFSDAAAVDIVTAVAEVATNGIVHGDAPRQPTRLAAHEHPGRAGRRRGRASTAAPRRIPRTRRASRHRTGHVACPAALGRRQGPHRRRHHLGPAAFPVRRDAPHSRLLTARPRR